MDDDRLAPEDSDVSVPQFLVAPEALAGADVVLRGTELHHLRVRRLRVGSSVLLSDGCGQQRAGVIVALDRHEAVIRIASEHVPTRESALHLVLAQALLKGDKMDWLVEKVTELGVNEIVTFTCARSLRSASGERHARWQRIAAAAAKQSQRGSVPIVTGPLRYEHLLARQASVRLVFWEEARDCSVKQVHAAHPVADSVLALIGPAGGLSAAEAERAGAEGAALVTLGPRLLRAETAGLVATTLVQFLWGDFCRAE